MKVRQAKFTAGAAPTKRRSAQANEQALRNLVTSYYDRTGLEFLRGSFQFGSGLTPVARLLTNPPILKWCGTILRNSTQVRL